MSCARSVCVHVCGLEDDNDFHSRGASAAPTRHSANAGALAPERLLPSRAPKFGHQTTEHGRESLSPWVSEAGRQCRMISHPPDAPPMRPKGRANPALRLSASASSPGCRRVRGRRTGGEGGPAPAGSSRAVSVAGLLPAAAFGFIPTASAAGSQPTACLLHAGGFGWFLSIFRLHLGAPSRMRLRVEETSLGRVLRVPPELPRAGCTSWLLGHRHHQGFLLSALCSELFPQGVPL